jgi:hypothetical protein
MHIVKLQCCAAWKNGWQVISPKKSFAVFAATPTEKAEWMAHINKCIVDLLAKSKLRITIRTGRIEFFYSK